MNLGEFKAQISQNIRRGNSLDGFIPQFIRQAALWIERNHTLQYMGKFATVEVNPESDTPRYISLANTYIKTVKMLRWDINGEFRNLTKADPRDFRGVEKGVPAFYWMDGIASIVLSGEPDEVLNGELWVDRYTVWPTEPTATHWLMTFAEDVLEARTMINVAKHIRDPGMRAHWQAVFDEGLVGLYAAEAEAEWGNSNVSMGQDSYGRG